MNDLADISQFADVQRLNWRGIVLRPDEPTFNLITRVMLLTPTNDRFRITEELFGSRSIRTERPFHVGFGQLAQVTNSTSSASSETVVDKHSMLALFKPFAEPSRYARACQFALSNSSHPIQALVGLRKSVTYRSEPAICIDCTRDELANPRFAAGSYHRSHQVLAATHCSTHETALIDKCLACGNSFSHWELPSLTCNSCGATLVRPKESQISDIPNLPARIRLSQMIAAAFAGEIPSVNLSHRLHVLRARTEIRVPNRSGVIGDNLAAHLNNVFGRHYLASLGLATDTSPTFGWPALLVHGKFMTYDPIANCLLAAALFDSVDDYCDQLNRGYANCCWNELSPTQLAKPGSLTYSSLKKALRAPSLELLIREDPRANATLVQWVTEYPGLVNRRSSWLGRRHQSVRR